MTILSKLLIDDCLYTFPFKKDELQSERIDVHRIASMGRLADVMYAFQLSPLSILKRDENGWQPIHEAARSGHLNVVKFFVEKGVPINSRTGKDGNGGSVLWWAQRFHGDNHPLIQYLKENKAINIAPNSRGKIYQINANVDDDDDGVINDDDDSMDVTQDANKDDQNEITDDDDDDGGGGGGYYDDDVGHEEL